MISMEIVESYPNYIGFDCPICGSEEVAYKKDDICTSCGKEFACIEDMWYSAAERVKFYSKMEG